jgi:hypothetical protein
MARNRFEKKVPDCSFHLSSVTNTDWRVIRHLMTVLYISKVLFDCCQLLISRFEKEGTEHVPVHHCSFHIGISHRYGLSSHSTANVQMTRPGLLTFRPPVWPPHHCYWCTEVAPTAMLTLTLSLLRAPKTM